MEKTITAEELVKGQKNLDIMKAEIYTVTEILSSIASLGNFEEKLGGFETKNCMWCLLKRDSELAVLCGIKNKNPRFRVYLRPREPIPLHLVELIHSDLNSFIEEVLLRYPFIMEHVRYHKSASKVF